MSRSRPVRALIGFGRFWWDFLVGDTPEIFLAVVVTLVAVALLSEGAHHPGVAAALLVVMALVTLVLSVTRAARQR